MIFGQSIFESVLDRLNREEAEQAAEPPPKLVVPGLKAGFVAETPVPPDETYASLQQAYFDFPAPPKEPPKPPEMPPHLKRLSPKDIAEDLALHEGDTADSLSRKRRKFALENHPDIIPPLWHDKANQRMKIANLMIDEALRRIALRGG